MTCLHVSTWIGAVFVLVVGWVAGTGDGSVGRLDQRVNQSRPLDGRAYIYPL